MRAVVNRARDQSVFAFGVRRCDRFHRVIRIKAVGVMGPPASRLHAGDDPSRRIALESGHDGRAAMIVESHLDGSGGAFGCPRQMMGSRNASATARQPTSGQGALSTMIAW